MPARRHARSTVAAVAFRATVFGGLVLATLAASGCHRGASRPKNHDSNAFAWNGALAAPGVVQVVQIRNTSGSITVTPSADNAVHVVAATSWSRGDPKKDVRFDAVTSGSTVTVCALWGDGTCTATDYTSKAKHRGVNFSWSSGTDASVDFTVQVPAGVKVDAWTVSGAVTVRAAAPVTARTIDGNVMVGTSVGPVDAESMNGDVDIRMTTVGSDTGAIRAVTKNGTATAWVPEITNGRIETSTLNGEIGSDFGSGKSSEDVGHIREFKTTMGTGTREYLVQTLNGSAWLRLINADGSVNGAGATTSSVGDMGPARMRPIRPPLTKRNQ